VIRIEPFQAEPPMPNAPCITERRRDFDAILQNNWLLRPRAELGKFSIYRIAKLTPGHCLTRSEPPDLPKTGDQMHIVLLRRYGPNIARAQGKSEEPSMEQAETEKLSQILWGAALSRAACTIA
jgi:hypothetical protein